MNEFKLVDNGCGVLTFEYEIFETDYDITKINNIYSMSLLKLANESNSMNRKKDILFATTLLDRICNKENYADGDDVISLNSVEFIPIDDSNYFDIVNKITWLDDDTVLFVPYTHFRSYGDVDNCDPNNQIIQFCYDENRKDNRKLILYKTRQEFTPTEYDELIKELSKMIDDHIPKARETFMRKIEFPSGLYLYIYY